MSEDNRKALSKYRLERAYECIKSAEALEHIEEK